MREINLSQKKLETFQQHENLRSLDHQEYLGTATNIMGFHTYKKPMK